MDYQQAAKLADSSTKPRENFMVIKMAYDFKLVLPHKTAVALLDSLAQAEQLYQEYNQQHRICAVEPNRITANVMSHKEYREYKIAALMGIKIEQVKEHQLIKDTA